MFSLADEAYMRRALNLATQAMNHATPNPRVGCVIVRDDLILAEGFTQPPGEAHAEAHALKIARSRGVSLNGATAYVTLEPCNHFGRTAPCTEALISAGIIRVIAAIEDPNPIVSGKGLARLREAGLDVRAGLCAQEAAELNLGFIKRMTRDLPWVRCKIAASMDGRTALADGQSQWITGAEARHDGHLWRARACAILTGAGTVRQDDPRLTVRNIHITQPLRQPLRVVFDGSGTLPENARVLQGGALVFCGDKLPTHLSEDVEVVALPDGHGKIDVLAAFKLLASRGVNELHVEAGASLSGRLIEVGLVDELLVYLAPKLLGGDAQPMFVLSPLADLVEASQWSLHDLTRIGSDVRCVLRTPQAITSLAIVKKS